MEQYIIEHGCHTAPPFIDAATVYRLLNVPRLLEALHAGLKHFSAGVTGGVVVPVRTAIHLPDNASFLTMPAYTHYDNGLAVKLVSVFPGNVRRNLLVRSSTIVLLDAATGETLSNLDGIVITAIRTAAISALAIRTFVRKPSGVVAILGAGLQARSHILVLRQVYDVTQLRIYNRTAKRAHDLAGEIRLGAVQVCDSVQAAVDGADVIITVTMATNPILLKKWVKKGAVIAAVGSFRSDRQEIGDELMRTSAVIVDSREAALKEAGDIIRSKAEIRAELGEVFSGKRTDFVNDEETVVFKSVGMALEDVISAKLVYDKFVAEKSLADDDAMRLV